MKLALRFLLFALLGILLVVAGSTALNFRRELGLFDVDLQRDHRVLAHALAPAFLMTWERDGQSAALGLLSRVNLTEGLLQSRWVPAGSPGAPGPELAPTQDGLLQVVQHPNVVLGRAKIIRNAPGVRDDAARNAQIIEEQVSRMTRIIRQLLDFARTRESQRVPADASELVEHVVGLLQPLAEKQGTLLALGPLASDVRIDADQSQLEQVLSNLTVNALQALQSGGTVRFAVRTTPAGTPEGATRDEYVVIDVEDTGPGMAPQVMARVFEPFFTTKDVGEGTGLGLSVAYGIVQEHGGFFTVDSALGRGSRFSVHLPSSASVSRENGAPDHQRLRSA